MTFTSCTDELELKYPLFKKSHFLYNINYYTEMLSVYIFVCLKMLVTVVIYKDRLQKVLLQSESSFRLLNNIIRIFVSST